MLRGKTSESVIARREKPDAAIYWECLHEIATTPAGSRNDK